MAQNVYECLLILDSNRYARDPGGVSGQVNEAIENLGGNVLASRLWTEQKLAYPINGHRKGTYWLAYFELEGEKLPDFNRVCQLNENFLRQLTLKVDPRLVDTLVAHAHGEEVATPESEDEEASAEKGETEEESTSEEEVGEKAEVS